MPAPAAPRRACPRAPIMRGAVAESIRFADHPEFMGERVVEYIATADGARLAVKRRRGIGTPIIFVPGLAVNADIWDAPDFRGPDFAFRSLATLLNEADFDIWLLNLRGSGSQAGRSAPPEGQRDWCVDHFIAFDLAATVEHVRRHTGRRPFLIGNSMGAMTIAGWAQGAVILDTGAGQRVTLDDAATRTRQADVAGLVLVEFPAALRWPRSVYDANGSLRWSDLMREWRLDDHASNAPFEMIARWPWLETLIAAAGNVRLDWLRPAGPAPDFVDTTADAADLPTRLKVSAMRWYSDHFKGAAHFQAETFSDGLLRAVDHMKSGVLRQMARSVRRGAFVSRLGEPDHVYSDHYNRITVPTLVVTGGRDRIASADVTRELFFDRVGSTDKTLRHYDSISHGEFEYAPIAFQLVYPDVMTWIAERN